MEFFTQVLKAVQVIEELGNPFADDTKDLFTLDTKIIMPGSVVESVKNIESAGKKLHDEFVDGRLTNDTSRFNDSIPRNHFPLFKNSFPKQQAKASKTSQLQTDIQLFSRLYIASQSRNGDMDVGPPSHGVWL